MARYRSIPTEIDAWQFMPDDPNIPEWIDPKWFHEERVPLPPVPGARDRERRGSPIILLPTNHGSGTVRIGEWVIRSPDGEVYPCRDDVFRKKYQPAEQPDRLVYQMTKLVPYEERWFNDRVLGEKLGYKLMATYRLVVRE